MLVSEAVAAMIEDWIGRSRYNNLNVLACRSGISYSTVARLAQAKVEKPQLDVLVSILPVISSLAAKTEFLRTFYPGVLKLIERDQAYQQVDTSKETQTFNPEFEELFQDPSGFLLGQHLLSRSGISSDKIKELYGEAGLTILQSLEAKGQVQFEDGVWRTHFNYSAKSFEAGKQQLVQSAKAFRPDSLKVSSGFMGVMSESVTLDAAQEMTREIQDCYNRLRAIRDRNPGRHVFVTSMGTYLADPQAAFDEEASR